MASRTEWIGLQDERLDVTGLPWFETQAPKLWRLPGDALDDMPEGVRKQARFPGGGRIRFCCETSQLHTRVRGFSENAGQGIDLYVNGSYWRTGHVIQGEESDIVFFDGIEKGQKAIDLYLPYRQELEVLDVGVDVGAKIESPPPYQWAFPVVFYGSSVAQGVGVRRSSMSYASVISRQLGVDVVNLGFGGAGKAEACVVELVNQVNAACYVLDLGKSYGTQSAEAYIAMVRTLRASHSDVPIVCITPIFSAREHYEPGYADLSQHTRDVVRRSAEGVDGVHVVEGLDLLGPGGADGFSTDGLHPSELGFQQIADRLSPVIRQLVLSA